MSAEREQGLLHKLITARHALRQAQAYIEWVNLPNRKTILPTIEAALATTAPPDPSGPVTLDTSDPEVKAIWECAKAAVSCKACKTRQRRGLDGQCPACASERARAARKDSL